MSQRDIKAPIFTGDITNSIIKIYDSLSPVQFGVILAVAVLTLAAVGLLLWQTTNPGAQAARPPDPHLFRAVPFLDSSQAVTALALSNEAEHASLWIGTQSGTQYALYRLDSAQQAAAVPQHVLDVKERIIELEVDCRGNVWVLINQSGVLVYRPQTTQHSTVLDQTTTHNWLVKNTTYAIATRCEDDAVEVWLGREGVHTLRYVGDYPTSDTITFTPWKEDRVFQASQALSDIRALYYAPDSEILWAASSMGKQLSFSFKGVLAPSITDEPDCFWSLSQSPDKTMWMGGSQHLVRIGDKNSPIGLTLSDGKPMDVGAFTLAAGRDWVWFGGRCSDEAIQCRPLGVYASAQGPLFDVGLENIGKEVADIVVDATDTVWIGAEKGLIVYPAPGK